MERVRTHGAFIQEVATTKHLKTGQKLLKEAKPAQLDALCEIILNILRGNIPLEKRARNKAGKHKTVLRKLAKKCLKKVIRKKLFIKYFTIIKKVISTVLPFIGIALTTAQLL